jgi:nitrogen fixation protein FixH
LEEARLQKALGWRSELTVAADGEVHARVDDTSGRVIRNLSVFVTLSRRVGDATEIKTSLVRSADGYVGWLDAPAAGYWRATLTASDDDGHRYRMQFDLEIPR